MQNEVISRSRYENFAFGPIMHHEEPSAHFFFRRVHGIARDGLLNL